MTRLDHYIPSPVVAVAAAYANQTDDADIYICGARILDNECVQLEFANGHQLHVHQFDRICRLCDSFFL